MPRSGPDQPPIVPLIRNFLQDLALLRFRPQIIFRHDVSEPLTKIMRRVQWLQAASRVARNPGHLTNLIAGAVTPELARIDGPVDMAASPLPHALVGLACSLAEDNGLVFELPTLDPLRPLSLTEESELRLRLAEFEFRLINEATIHAQFVTAITSLVTALIDGVPSVFFTDSRGSQSIATAPIVALMHDPKATLSELLSIVFTGPPDDDGRVAEHCLAETRNQLFQNLLTASGLNTEQALQHPNRLVTPDRSPLDPVDMAATYLAGTPFHPVFATPVPFVIPKPARFEHAHIIGGTGHGKTQLLQTLALADFDDPDAPGVVVIDSQGDMVRKLSHLASFARSDRLIIVDPSDTQFPLALNVFDIHKERLKNLTLGQREQILAGIIELYDYIFGSIGAELTQKQGVVFRYITRLMLDIPGATIQTLRQLMEDEKPFRPFIERLTGTTRAFFDNEFSDKSFVSTKQQIRRRLYGILSNPTFERIFSSDRNKLDMTAALNSGKVVLINTAKDVLKAEASAFFGRYMIALVMQAAFERAAIPESQRRPAFLYIDEAADYFDANIDTLLIQARKFKLGVTLAHQFLDQLTPSLRASIMTNPAVRFAGGVSHKDANALDADMRTTNAFLMSTRKHQVSTDFVCFVRNVTPAAIKLSIPIGKVESLPRMTDEDYAQMIDRSRAIVAEPLAAFQNASTVPPGTPSAETPTDPAIPSTW